MSYDVFITSIIYIHSGVSIFIYNVDAFVFIILTNHLRVPKEMFLLRVVYLSNCNNMLKRKIIILKH